MKRFYGLGCLLVATIGISEDPPKPPKLAAEVDPTCKKADEAWRESLRVADEVASKAKREAAAIRYRTYKSQLMLATKAGDFDRATAIKAAIELMEADPDGYRPKPKNVVRFEGHSYALIREPATWHVAKSRCEQMGGHLACLETPSEIGFVANLMKAAKVDAWIGATDELKEGDWRWITGKPAVLPQSAIDDAAGTEHHLHWLNSHERWNDSSASARLAYVCEWDQ